LIGNSGRFNRAVCSSFRKVVAGMDIWNLATPNIVVSYDIIIIIGPDILVSYDIILQIS
jgi:hypothetical protein